GAGSRSIIAPGRRPGSRPLLLPDCPRSGRGAGRWDAAGPGRACRGLLGSRAGPV
ncbi:MAG: hypothetical protein AVDCRST_MAG59-2914, partial [uncultured Thermomicrobiales bacterium]